jgi:hypothetical protein
MQPKARISWRATPKAEEPDATLLRRQNNGTILAFNPTDEEAQRIDAIAMVFGQRRYSYPCGT